MASYRKMEGPKADACTMCGQCEAKCTQHLKIIDEMKYAAKEFGPAGKWDGVIAPSSTTVVRDESESPPPV